MEVKLKCLQKLASSLVGEQCFITDSIYTFCITVDGMFQLRLKSVDICQQWYSKVSILYGHVTLCIKSHLDLLFWHILYPNIYRIWMRPSNTVIISKRLLLKQLSAVASVIFQLPTFLSRSAVKTLQIQ